MKKFNNCINTKKIEELRINKGYSISKLCLESKICYQTYKRILNGEDFKLVALFKLARILDINIVDFFR